MAVWTVAVKELIDVAGIETTANTAVVLPDRWRWPPVDAPVISRLRAAGVTIGAKTTTHEFAWGITTAQPDRERAVNPLAPDRVTGGSSGGAAAAVARGDARFAVATDTGGSVRIPAAWCGLVGWKPTAGVVPTRGVLPLAPSLDHVGFIAADVATLTKVASWFGVRRPPPSLFRVAGARTDAPIDRESLEAVGTAIERLTTAGARSVGTRAWAASDTLMSCYRAIQMREALGVHRGLFQTWPAQRGRYGSDVAARLALAEGVSEAEEITARVVREEIRSDLLAQLADRVVVVTATTGCAPPFVDHPDVALVDGMEHSLRDVVMPHTVAANLAGLPVVCVPVGSGTPATSDRSVQLVGRPGSDGLLLTVAAIVAEQ